MFYLPPSVCKAFDGGVNFPVAYAGFNFAARLIRTQALESGHFQLQDELQ